VQCRPVTSSVQSYMWIRHADIAFCGISLSPSLLGVKRTWLVAACVSRRIFHVLCACPARGPLFTCGSPYKPTMTRCDCSRAQLPSTLVVVDRLGEPRTPRLFHFPSVIQRGQSKGPGRVTNPALTTAPLWGGETMGGAVFKTTFCRVAPFLFSPYIAHMLCRSSRGRARLHRQRD
jgi:hypothetical protein